MRVIALTACGAVLWAAVVSGQAQPPDPEALVKQGRAFFSRGQHDEAERLYRQALAASPRSFEAARALGILLNIRGQYPEARTHLERAVKVAPSITVRHQAMATLALSYAFEGKLDAVVREFEALRRQQQEDADASGAAASARSLGRILLEAGDIANGRKWYEIGYQEWKPLPAQPESERLLWELRWRHMQARISAREGKIDDAKRLVSEFETLMKKRGKLAEDNAIYRWVAGYVAFYAREYDVAIDHLTHGDTDDPFILDLIGKAYEAKGDLTNARQYYRRVMESNVYNLQSAIARPHARAKLTGQPSAEPALDAARIPASSSTSASKAAPAAKNVMMNSTANRLEPVSRTLSMNTSGPSTVAKRSATA
jgi:tetratricopeptide (TPR) repeat protein